MTQVGSVYGQALYDLAKSEGLDEAIWQELRTLDHCFSVEEPNFIKLLSTPNLNKEERCQILDDCFRDKIQPYLLNFMKILTEKGYMRHFHDCRDSYRQLYCRDHNILTVNATAAVALNPQQTQRLTQKLQTITGKHVDLSIHVDPQVVGGIRLDYDGKQLDDTLQHRLDDISKLLKNTVL